MLQARHDFGTVFGGGLPTSSHALVVELADIATVSGHIAAWRDLETRALDSNAFYSADFLLAAAHHLRDGGTPDFILVFGSGTASRRLLGLFPVFHTRTGRGGAILRGWTNPYVTFGAPLVDREHGVEVLSAAFGFIADAWPETKSFLLPDLNVSSPLAQAIRAESAASGRPIAHLSEHRRAVFDAAEASEPAGFERLRKRRKELRRTRRRLSEQGDLQFRLIGDSVAVHDGLERFLALEARGWKGTRGTALVQTPARASFTRTMLWSMARTGNAQIASLELDGKTLASVLLLTAGDKGFLWKIAYDEAYARWSPGVMLIEELSHTLRGLKHPARIDSCAEEGNRMIEDMWSERITVADLLVGLDPEGAPAFKATLAREQLRRSLRARVKSIYRRLRGWDQA